MSCQDLQHLPYIISRGECVWLNTIHLYGSNGDQDVGLLLGHLKKSSKLKDGQCGFPDHVDLNKHGYCMEFPSACEKENASMDILFLWYSFYNLLQVGTEV